MKTVVSCIKVQEVTDQQEFKDTIVSLNNNIINFSQIQFEHRIREENWIHKMV